MKERLYINDKVQTQFGMSRIKAIGLYQSDAIEGEPIWVKSIWADLSDRCIFDLDNSHWVYGHQIED